MRLVLLSLCVLSTQSTLAQSFTQSDIRPNLVQSDRTYSISTRLLANNDVNSEAHFDRLKKLFQESTIFHTQTELGLEDPATVVKRATQIISSRNLPEITRIPTETYWACESASTAQYNVPILPGEKCACYGKLSQTNFIFLYDAKTGLLASFEAAEQGFENGKIESTGLTFSNGDDILLQFKLAPNNLSIVGEEKRTEDGKVKTVRYYQCFDTRIPIPTDY